MISSREFKKYFSRSSITFNITIIINILFLINILQASSSSSSTHTSINNLPRITFESLKNDPKTLRDIARAIFYREQELGMIQNKMCTHHSPELRELWLKNKQNQISSEDRQRAIRDFGLKPGDLKSILRRKGFFTIDPSYANNPRKFITLLDNGTVTLDKGPDTQVYGIRIEGTLPDYVGTIDENEEKEPTQTKEAYIAFNVQDIIDKIINTQDIHSWNRNLDGKINTICPKK